jgi:hypothetical protein
LSQIEFETPRAPEVVDEPGAPQHPHVGVGQPELRARLVAAGRRRSTTSGG